ncbi:MAG: hypothetical protein HW407_318 [Bacteroidetes bacterium]|nr:hypothetical protein [Bacteroidota bacterium]
MVHFIRRVSLLLLVCVTVPGALRAQETISYSQSAENTFQDGIEAFAQERYADAVSAFDQVIRSGGPNQRTTAAYVMKAKALLHQQETLEAAKTLRTFLFTFPSSSYVPDAEFTMGLLQLRIQRYGDAAASFMTAWRGAKSLPNQARLVSDARTALQRTLEFHLTSGDVRQMIGASSERDERAFLWLTLAKKEISDGRVSATSIILDTLDLQYVGNPFGEEIALLRGQLQQRSSVKIGALLPVMRKSEPSAMKEIGTEIEEGVQFAVEEYAKDSTTRVKVTLVTRDTERDPLVAARGIQELTSDDNIIGIIGPVFSNEAAAAVGLANSRGYPLVTPTANANGIAAVGQYIFQANPDYDTRGRAMARYAVQVKGMKVLAVLAPIDAFGKFMAEAFAGEALRLGAKVIATEWYQRGASDLTGQLANIRKAGMLAGVEPTISFAGQVNQADIAKLVQLGVPLSTIDSLLDKSSMVKATEFLGPDAKRLIDSLGITALYEEPKTDSLQYPVTTIDGIYIPISGPGEIGIASSQIVFFNFKTHILGSGEWNSFADLDANKRYCDGVIFESDYFVDSKSPDYVEFFNRFYERFKKRPGKNTLYGYDATRMMLDAIQTGSSTREGLMRSLQGVREYRGFHSRIGFSDNRVNSWLWILQYSGDQIRKLDEIQVE